LEQFSDELHALIELPAHQLRPGYTPPTFIPQEVLLAAANSRLEALNEEERAVSQQEVDEALAKLAEAKRSKTAPDPADTNRWNQYGDALRRLIVTKTSVANKYMQNLTRAVADGQYIPVDGI